MLMEAKNVGRRWHYAVADGAKPGVLEVVRNAGSLNG